MQLCAQTTLFKTKTYWRAGPPILIGILDLAAKQYVVIAELETFPYQDAELLLELHVRTESGSRTHHGKLEAVNSEGMVEPNLVGSVEIGDRVFSCTAMITPETLKSKSLYLDFWDVEKEEKPLQPAPSLKRRHLRQPMPRSMFS